MFLMLPGEVIGLAGGALFAMYGDVTIVTVLFVFGAIFMAWRMTSAPKNERQDLYPLPGVIDLSAKGFFVGVLNGAVGAGGLAVPIFLRYMTMQRAIGTSAALGIPIYAMAVSMFAAAPAPGGCETCLGFVYLPAVCAAGIAAVLTAPLGSFLAHNLPVDLLKRVFAVALVVAALNLGRKTLPPMPVLLQTINTAAFGTDLKICFCPRTSSVQTLTLAGIGKAR